MYSTSYDNGSVMHCVKLCERAVASILLDSGASGRLHIPLFSVSYDYRDFSGQASRHSFPPYATLRNNQPDKPAPPPQVRPDVLGRLTAHPLVVGCRRSGMKYVKHPVIRTEAVELSDVGCEFAGIGARLHLHEGALAGAGQHPGPDRGSSGFC